MKQIIRTNRGSACGTNSVNRLYFKPGLPAGTRIDAFPGKPNPQVAAVGQRPAPRYKRVYKHFRPATWVQQHWQ